MPHRIPCMVLYAIFRSFFDFSDSNFFLFLTGNRFYSNNKGYDGRSRIQNVIVEQQPKEQLTYRQQTK